jgi:hypothetical protein
MTQPNHFADNIIAHIGYSEDEIEVIDGNEEHIAGESNQNSTKLTKQNHVLREKVELLQRKMVEIDQFNSSKVATLSKRLDKMNKKLVEEKNNVITAQTILDTQLRITENYEIDVKCLQNDVTKYQKLYEDLTQSAAIEREQLNRKIQYLDSLMKNANSSPFTLNIELMNNEGEDKIIPIQVNSFTTILDIKEMIQGTEDIAVKDQKLFKDVLESQLEEKSSLRSLEINGSTSLYLFTKFKVPEKNLK